MGVYNRLFIERRSCARCGEPFDLWVQFKYGYARLIDYHLGETLRWLGRRDYGEPFPRVRVPGISEGCPQCSESSDPEEWYGILIEDNRFISAEPIPDLSPFGGVEADYVRLDDG